MIDETPNSIRKPREERPQNLAEYLYQGATILAALLIVLSAAV